MCTYYFLLNVFMDYKCNLTWQVILLDSLLGTTDEARVCNV
ncbi:protein of unknown function [Shewanella benthica]|uniref:Uncharacterized protein n=1 Tax=Shewanella benthica TaxID=43661 RepID=A0A330M6Y6_9GAMM|nr:protein of unknown function [Shewanella benthica]